MPRHEQQPEPRGDASPSQDSFDSATAKSPLEPGIMEGVLRETLRALETDAASDRVEIDALLGVAARHSGSPLSREPVARELISALLKRGFPQLAQSDELREQIALSIAGTLLEDPVQEALLRRFWEYLCEKAA